MARTDSIDKASPFGRNAMPRPGTDIWLLPVLRDAGPLGWILANLVVAGLYCTLGWTVSQFFAQYGLFPSPIWLPSSIALVAAMIGGMRMLPGLFLGSLIANYALFDPPIWEACIISLGNALGPILGAMAIRRLRPAAGLFARFRGVVIFILCAIILHPVLTASTGTIALAVSEGLPAALLPGIWVKWWLSDSGGTLFFAPAIILWLGLEHETIARQRAVDRLDLLLWGLGAAAIIVIFATLPADGPVRWAFPFLLGVPMSWIALQVSLRAAYTLISLVSIVASAAAVIGIGPFHAAEVGNPMQLVGVLVVLLALNVLTVVSLVSERREAQESDRFKSMFLASASHDLRTPLNAIIGFSDMMRGEVMGPLGAPRYREYVEHIHASGNILLNIVNDILDLSKIEAGRRQLTPAMLDARPVVESCIELIGPQAAGGAVTVTMEAGMAPMLFADDVALREILLNLLSNAVAFTPQGGTVTVRIKDAPDGDSMIEVADTGIGMDADGIEVALQPFGQVAHGAEMPQRGTGLGLPIAVRLAEMHGGHLEIESTPGKGTTVRVILPAAT